MLEKKVLNGFGRTQRHLTYIEALIGCLTLVNLVIERKLIGEVADVKRWP
jgi:hypothetical protein